MGKEKSRITRADGSDDNVNKLYSFFTEHKDEIMDVCGIDLNDVARGQKSVELVEDIIVKGKDMSLVPYMKYIRECTPGIANMDIYVQIGEMMDHGIHAVTLVGINHGIFVEQSRAESFVRGSMVIILSGFEAMRLQIVTRKLNMDEDLRMTIHELRRPLTTLSSYCQILEGGMMGVLPDQIREIISGIEESTESMIVLVTELSEWMRVVDYQSMAVIHTFDLTTVARDVCDKLSNDAKAAGMSIKFEGGKEERIVCADSRHIHLAISNMVYNAIGHSPKNSVITVRCFAESEWAHIVVQDRGEGIGEGVADHLFEKYFRSPRLANSYFVSGGLGLYIVRTVIENAGGSVNARNRDGGGAEFEFKLPLYVERDESQVNQIAVG